MWYLWGMASSNIGVNNENNICIKPVFLGRSEFKNASPYTGWIMVDTQVFLTVDIPFKDYNSSQVNVNTLEL